MKKKVILIHGYNKNENDMIILKENLERLNYEGVLVDLPLTFSVIEKGNLIFEEKMTDIIQKLSYGEKVSLVGHSSGGLIIRCFLSNNVHNKYLMSRIHRCVLIATPNKGSELADIASKIPYLFIGIFKFLESLRPENIKALQIKEVSNIELGAIAGSKSDLLLGKLLSEENDGRVEVNSVNYIGLKDFIIMPYGHKEIHYKFEIAKLVDCFLRNGSFIENESR